MGRYLQKIRPLLTVLSGCCSFISSASQAHELWGEALGAPWHFGMMSLFTNMKILCFRIGLLWIVLQWILQYIASFRVYFLSHQCPQFLSYPPSASLLAYSFLLLLLLLSLYPGQVIESAGVKSVRVSK